MMAASVISNFGTFNVTMASMARVLWAMARAPGDAKQLPSFVALSWRRAKTGTIRYPPAPLARI
jgi:amino acid transporter